MKHINRFIHSAVVLTAALFLVAVVLGGAQVLKAQDTSASGTKQGATSMDARITKLHDQLKITPAQEEQWNKLAQVMRENGVALRAAVEVRKEKGTMNAVDDLKSYSAVMDAQSEGMHKFIPAFEALYASLSDEQKKTADTVFTRHHWKHHHRGATKKK
jgi:hypothetical protein